MVHHYEENNPYDYDKQYKGDDTPKSMMKQAVVKNDDPFEVMDNDELIRNVRKYLKVFLHRNASVQDMPSIKKELLTYVGTVIDEVSEQKTLYHSKDKMSYPSKSNVPTRMRTLANVRTKAPFVFVGFDDDFDNGKAFRDWCFYSIPRYEEEDSEDIEPDTVVAANIFRKAAEYGLDIMISKFHDCIIVKKL